MRTNRWTSYTTTELKLLRELCLVQPPMLWKDIATRFPGRTEQALRDKARQEGLARTTGIRGRPRTKPIELPKCLDDDEHNPDQIRAATIQLGAAIDAMLARNGMRLAA